MPESVNRLPSSGGEGYYFRCNSDTHKTTCLDKCISSVICFLFWQANDYEGNLLKAVANTLTDHVTSVDSGDARLAQRPKSNPWHNQG
jgi:hypothetical protein